MEISEQYPFLPATLVQEAYSHTGSVESLLAWFRDQSLSKSESMIALSVILHMDPDEAKRAVHLSDVWSDAKAMDDGLARAALRPHLSRGA